MSYTWDDLERELVNGEYSVEHHGGIYHLRNIRPEIALGLVNQAKEIAAREAQEAHIEGTQGGILLADAWAEAVRSDYYKENTLAAFIGGMQAIQQICVSKGECIDCPFDTYEGCPVGNATRWDIPKIAEALGVGLWLDGV
jgi:hypothetical protein